MGSTRREIWFWQRIVSPHIAGLAKALAVRGHKVVYVAEESMSQHRSRQGWSRPDLGQVHLVIADNQYAMTEIAERAPLSASHLCQGIRSNGTVGSAQRVLTSRGVQQWVLLESVDDSGWIGILKRLVYRAIFIWKKDSVSGILAIGARTSSWVISRGFPSSRVFPFAYFISDGNVGDSSRRSSSSTFKFIFVGRLVKLKQVEQMFRALAAIEDIDYSVTIVGDGPLRAELGVVADKLLGDRVRWIGTVAMEEVPRYLASADCLVLPSRFDGWGSVISESLMTGTPAICSDTCGASEVVRASNCGGVFRSGDQEHLTECLYRVALQGGLGVEERERLANWASAIGAAAGAVYLEEILEYVDCNRERPNPPWLDVSTQKIAISDSE